MRIFLVVLIFATGLMAKDGYYYDGKKSKQPDVKVVDNELYKKECATCHFGYQPGLLPSASWEWMMKTLDKHYGTDASIDDESNSKILAYLLENASEKAMNYKRSAKITQSLRPGVLYESITQIPYHIKKHDEVEKWMIEQKEVRTLANCTACHKKADEGNYGKRFIEIPNYGPWRKK